MAKRPKQAPLPVRRTRITRSFCSAPQTPEPPPSVSSNANPEQGRGSQRKRSREEPEEDPNPPKRCRTTHGPGPLQLEVAADSFNSSVNWESCVTALYHEKGRGSRRKRSRDKPEESPNPHKRCRTTHGPGPLGGELSTFDSSPETGEDPLMPTGKSSGSSRSASYLGGSSPFKKSGTSQGPGPLAEEKATPSRTSSVSSVTSSLGDLSRPEPTRVCSSTKTSLTTYTTAEFRALYQEREKLGAGAFGTVYAGYRKEDQLSVAIKHIPMAEVEMDKGDGKQTHIPREVRLMLRAADSGGPCSIVVLLDWFQLGEELILVQERPESCMDLRDYMNSKGGKLQEQEAKMVLQQAIRGIVELHSRGVIHRDIKPENLLVGSSSSPARIRIIDLGCGCDLQQGLYRSFDGTSCYIPPEYLLKGSYSAEAMTVWQIGVLLFHMLTGNPPFNTQTQILRKSLPPVRGDLSADCRDFLRRCLNKQALRRPPLESLLQVPWLQ